VVETELGPATRTIEREAAMTMVARHSPGSRRLTLGADKAYDVPRDKRKDRIELSQSDASAWLNQSPPNIGTNFSELLGLRAEHLPLAKERNSGGRERNSIGRI
jgi:hypothetical protein